MHNHDQLFLHESVGQTSGQSHTKRQVWHLHGGEEIWTHLRRGHASSDRVEECDAGKPTASHAASSLCLAFDSYHVPLSANEISAVSHLPLLWKSGCGTVISTCSSKQRMPWSPSGDPFSVEGGFPHGICKVTSVTIFWLKKPPSSTVLD